MVAGDEGDRLARPAAPRVGVSQQPHAPHTPATQRWLEQPRSATSVQAKNGRVATYSPRNHLPKLLRVFLKKIMKYLLFPNKTGLQLIIFLSLLFFCCSAAADGSKHTEAALLQIRRLPHIQMHFKRRKE